MTHLPDPYLIGNGRWCSCCFPEGPPSNWQHFIPRVHRKLHRGCNECAGEGRIIFTPEQIIAATVAENASHRRAAA